MIWSTPSGRYWNSWGDPGRLQREMDQLFGRYAGSPTAGAGEFPAVNVWTGDDRAVLTAEVPGVDPKDIELTVANETITIRGSRETGKAKEGETPEGCTLAHREYQSGDYERAFTLGEQIDRAGIQATVSNGVLRLILPKAKEVQPKRIAVKAG